MSLHLFAPRDKFKTSISMMTLGYQCMWNWNIISGSKFKAKNNDLSWRVRWNGSRNAACMGFGDIPGKIPGRQNSEEKRAISGAHTAIFHFHKQTLSFLKRVLYVSDGKKKNKKTSCVSAEVQNAISPRALLRGAVWCHIRVWTTSRINKPADRLHSRSPLLRLTFKRRISPFKPSLCCPDDF